MRMRPTRSKPSISLADGEGEFVAGRRGSWKLLAYLIEQPRSASILVQSHRMNLAQESFPMRHDHFAAVDFDLDLLTSNFAEQTGDGHPPALWSSPRIAGLSLLESTILWRIFIPASHLVHPVLLSCHSRRKRSTNSVLP